MYLKILSPTRHNGDRLDPDAIVEMEAKQAAILIADGIAEETAKPETVKEPAKSAKSAKSTQPDKAEKTISDSAGSSSTGNDKEPTNEDSAMGDDDGKDDLVNAE